MYDTKTYASLPPWQALVDPSENVRHHFFLADVVEQVVVMALVESERFVGGTGIVVERLAPAQLCRGMGVTTLPINYAICYILPERGGKSMRRRNSFQFSSHQFGHGQPWLNSRGAIPRWPC
jgi:hypothetical protein